MDSHFLIKIIGIFVGVLARMVLPWLRKLRDGEIQRFNWRYLYSSLASLALGIIITMLIFPRFEGSSGAPPGFESGFKLFCLAFGFGFGSNSLVMEAGQWSVSLRRRKNRLAK